MLEFSIHRCNGFSRKGLRDRCVTNVALIPDLLAVAAEMLSVMTTKAPPGNCSGRCCSDEIANRSSSQERNMFGRSIQHRVGSDLVVGQVTSATAFKKDADDNDK